MKRLALFYVLAGFLIACTPQAASIETTPTLPDPTQTALSFTPTITSTSPSTSTALPADTPSAIPPTCAVAINPRDNATVPAHGQFDFQWTDFTGAASYIVSIGPTNWYPTNFPVTGTVLTRYMETLTNGPSFEWSITALNAAGQEICKTGPYTFVTSAQVSATASFNTNVDVSNSNNTSDGLSNNGSNDNGSNNSSSNNPTPDVLTMIIGDNDDAQCRLGISYRVKSNMTFDFIRVQYSANGQQGYIDLTPSSQDPYPAYNVYYGQTPPLPVKQGDEVLFGIWIKLAGIDGESGGMGLSHTMTNCSP